MKITLRLACADDAMHIDSLDLHRNGERRCFGEETGIGKADSVACSSSWKPFKKPALIL